MRVKRSGANSLFRLYTPLSVQNMKTYLKHESEEMFAPMWKYGLDRLYLSVVLYVTWLLKPLFIWLRYPSNTIQKY